MNDSHLSQPVDNLFASKTASPSKIRMRQIADKLSGLQAGLDEEKQARRDAIEMKLKVLEEKLTKTTVAEETKLNGIKEQLGKLEDQISTNRAARDVLDERKTKELRLVESSITLDLGVEKQARKDSEAKILKAIDERCYTLRLELAKEKKAREEAEEKQNREMAEEILRLSESLDGERRDREDKYSRMIKKLNTEIDELTKTLGDERKEREDSEQTMFKMLEDVSTRIMADIGKERQDRESTEETLLKLLEQTCSSVEASLRANE